MYSAIVAEAMERLRAAFTKETDSLQEECRQLRQVEGGEVWYWQGDGGDFPESLTCPVVISAETLREWIGKVSKSQKQTSALKIIRTLAGNAKWALERDRMPDRDEWLRCFDLLLKHAEDAIESK